MKKTRATFWICLVACIIQAVAEILLFVNIWNLQMIPERYIVLLASGLVILQLLTVLLAFVKGANPASTLRRCVAAILALIIAVACAVGYFLVSDFRDTMDNVITEEPSGIPMAVFVREDDPAQMLSDVQAYTFAIVDGYETERTEYTVASIEDQLHCKIKTQVFPSVFDMVDALYAADVGALILNPAYEDILVEMEGYTDFSDRTRILCDIMTPDTVENNSNNSSETEPLLTDPATTDAEVQATKPVTLGITERTFIVYLSGTDTKAKVYRTCRSDVNIIAVVNPVAHQVLLLNTPRDYYVPNPAGNNQPDKLTHCGMYGVENSVRTLTALYGIDIDYYARINFSGFEKLIDAIGGITVHSPTAFKAGAYMVKKGENVLNGADALSFARERYHVAGGDNGRGKNQMKVITAVINKLTSSTALISNYSGIIDSLGDMFTMSIPSTDVSAMVKMQLEDMPQWEIFTFAVTGVNTRAETYSMPGRRLSVMLIDEEYVAHGAKLVNRMLAGERINKEDLEMNK